MKIKFILGLVVAGSLSVVSCKKELQPQESPAATDANAVAQAPADPNAMQANTPQPVAQPVPQPASQPQPTSTTTAPGMNPPHGQPNHRCDIAVGAPLNSPPGQKPATQPTQAQMQPQPQPVQPQQGSATITPAATAPGMNPPHGQAGHRCDVAVGAPLPQ